MSNPGGARLTKNDKREAAREQARIQREEQRKKDRRNKWSPAGRPDPRFAGHHRLVTVLIINGTKPAGPGPLNMASDGIQIGQGFVAKSTPALKSGDEPCRTSATSRARSSTSRCTSTTSAPSARRSRLTNGDYLAGLVENGGATVEIHPISFLDNQSLGNKYSSRAANAAACVANYSPNQYWDFNRALFENQPAEGTEGLSDER